MNQLTKEYYLKYKRCKVQYQYLPLDDDNIIRKQIIVGCHLSAKQLKQEIADLLRYERRTTGRLDIKVHNEMSLSELFDELEKC